MVARGADAHAACTSRARREQVRARVLVAEHRLRDEIATHESEHVPVAGVAARHPDAAHARNRPTTGRKSSTSPKMPAQRCATVRAADEIGRRTLERALDRRRRHLRS